MLKSYFTYVTSGLSIGFVNLSSGNPDVFKWDFGEGTTSTEKNPTVLFVDAGVYDVSLEVSRQDAAETTDTITLSVTVSSAGTHLPAGIFGSIYQRIPDTLLPSAQAIDGYIKKWQLSLCTLIDPNISENEAFNELVWPPLVNELILNLVMFDLVADAILKLTYGAGITQNGTESGGGGLKSVETGPAKAEFYDNSISSTQSVNYLASAFKDQLNMRICILAARCRVPLEMCQPLSQDVFSPKVWGSPPKTVSPYTPYIR